MRAGRQVYQELTYQARRLDHHASIAIWGGNNEIEVAFGWFPESRDPDKARLYAADYNQARRPLCPNPNPSLGALAACGAPACGRRRVAAHGAGARRAAVHRHRALGHRDGQCGRPLCRLLAVQRHLQHRPLRQAVRPPAGAPGARARSSRAGRGPGGRQPAAAMPEPGRTGGAALCGSLPCLLLALLSSARAERAARRAQVGHRRLGPQDGRHALLQLRLRLHRRARVPALQVRVGVRHAELPVVLRAAQRDRALRLGLRLRDEQLPVRAAGRPRPGAAPSCARSAPSTGRRGACRPAPVLCCCMPKARARLGHARAHAVSQRARGR